MEEKDLVADGANNSINLLERIYLINTNKVELNEEHKTQYVQLMDEIKEKRRNYLIFGGLFLSSCMGIGSYLSAKVPQGTPLRLLPLSVMATVGLGGLVGISQMYMVNEMSVQKLNGITKDVDWGNPQLKEHLQGHK